MHFPFGRLCVISFRHFSLQSDKLFAARSTLQRHFLPTMKLKAVYGRNSFIDQRHEFSGILNDQTRRFSIQHIQPEPDECILLVENLKLLVVLQHAFNLSAEEFDKYFYRARVRINKQRIGEKQIKIKENDTVDLIKGITKTHVSLKRIHVKSIKQSKPQRVEVDVWDKLTLPRILSQENDCPETQTQ
uniref:TLE family member 5 n=1 Tax=Phallusia mammillata TaxID=59560 RepID=A0A6F9DVI8_9ASCI|nr:TLE family member 5 [Phallusia mammillata]